ncbi:MAG TPA: lipopolysaccharide heptosyltransferase I [Xanthobacteraceae bacterium]
MTNVLFIKTSSLGDVIHHMPAIAEARRRLPDARFAWVVEEAFAPLVRLHPAVDAVIPVASRRWRHAPFAAATWAEVRAFIHHVRSRRDDDVIDTQGLLRTALMAALAHGRRHGYDRHSIRESLASAFYDVRHPVSRDQHAIARNRMLTGLALGYVPAGELDFGLDRLKLAGPTASPYGILLHATARPEKEWPEAQWIALGRGLTARGLELVLPWGSETERQRSERIAAGVPGARVPPRAPLDAVARHIAGAQFVVGVDTGLLHLAAALGVPLVGIFVGSEPGLTGPMGRGPIAIIGNKGTKPATGDVLHALNRVSGN